MSIKLNDSIRVQGGKPVEDKRLNNGVVYNSVLQANTLIAKTDRYPTLEVAIKNGEDPTSIYWYKEGIEDSDLVLKQEAGSSSNITLEQARQNGNVLEGNIIGREEFDKQGDRKAFAQLSDIEDQFKNLPNASGTSSYNKMLVANSNGVVGVRDNLQSDKSSNATFNAFKVRNSNGDEAYVDNAYNALKQSFTKMTTTQALELSQLLAGGSGSTGAPDVNLISPPIIQNQYNTIEYVLLRGVNLKLNTTAMSIQILSADKATVVVTIPNSQIQLYDDGLSLVFYYNFHNFQIGEFFIRLVSGAKTYITTLSLKIVQSIENINLNAIIWDKMYKDGITPTPSDTAIGANFTVTSSTGNDIIPTISFKSNELFAEGENFYIEMKITLGARSPGGQSYIPSYVGLGYSGTPNLLTPSSLIYFDWGWASRSNHYLISNNGQILFSQQSPVEVNVIFIKTGNLFRTVIGSSNNSRTLSNNSGYSMFLQFVPRPSTTLIQGQIIKAFKFN